MTEENGQEREKTREAMEGSAELCEGGWVTGRLCSAAQEESLQVLRREMTQSDLQALRGVGAGVGGARKEEEDWLGSYCNNSGDRRQRRGPG